MAAGKWYQVGSPFVALDDTKTPKLNDVFTTGFSDGDQMSIFNSTTQRYVVYDWSSAEKAWGINDDWDGFIKTDVTLTIGQGVFINKKSNGNVVLSGKVSTSEAVVFGDEKGNSWTQITYSCPIETKLNTLTWTNLADGDQINVFDPATQRYTAYDWSSASNGWGINDDWDGFVLKDVPLAVGQAVFINKKSTGVGFCTFPQK